MRSASAARAPSSGGRTQRARTSAAASGLEMRTTPRRPGPGGEAIAAMVVEEGMGALAPSLEAPVLLLLGLARGALPPRLARLDALQLLAVPRSDALQRAGEGAAALGAGLLHDLLLVERPELLDHALLDDAERRLRDHVDRQAGRVVVEEHAHEHGHEHHHLLHA